MTINVPFNSASGIATSNFSSPVPVQTGGTGKTSLPDVIKELLPPQENNQDKFLSTDGQETLSWKSVEYNVSAGLTGLTAQKAKIDDESGNLIYNTILGGVLKISHGGTGQTSFNPGFIKYEPTGMYSIPVVFGSEVLGDIAGKSSGITGVVEVINGGTGKTSFTSGYIKSDGAALSSNSTIPGLDINGDIPGNSSNVTGVVAIEHGGTGKTTANEALNELLPDQLGNQNKYLFTDGSDSKWMYISSESLVGTALPSTVTVSSLTSVGTLSSLNMSGKVTFGQSYTETKTDITSAASVSIDCNLGNIFNITMSQSITSLTFSNIPPSGRAYSVTLFLTQDSTGNRTMTWPASVKWSDGTIPTLTTTANKTDVFTLVTFTQGTTWFGFNSGMNF